MGPGTAHGYHSMTYGWLVGEVIHRITGQLPGAFFADAVAGPLGLRTWLGLPAAESDTVAWGLAPPPDADPFVDPVAERGITMGGAFAFPADADGLVSFNDDAIQAAGFPGAGAVSTADGLARLYAACVSDSVADRLLDCGVGGRRDSRPFAWSAAARPAGHRAALGHRLPAALATGPAPAR